VSILETLTVNERLAVLALIAAGLFALAVLIIFRLRMTPLEKERRRRLAIHMFGRMGDGLLSDVQDNTLYYSYSVSGVAYSASQDITYLRSMVPPDVEVLVGPVTLKYMVRNPANSIVICEGWSGLRVRPAELTTSTKETNPNEATA